MDFPLNDLMDESACFQFLVDLLHPGGLACPRCGDSEGTTVHRRDRAPLLNYRRKGCRRIFNAYSGTSSRGPSAGPSSTC